jgi:hypothetical protein
MLANHFSERSMLGFISIKRREVFASLLPQPLRVAPSDLVRKRLFGNLRGIDSEAASLSVKIGIYG